MVARYICSSCDIKIKVNIVQNCCRNLAVRGLSDLIQHKGWVRVLYSLPFALQVILGGEFGLWVGWGRESRNPRAPSSPL